MSDACSQGQGVTVFMYNWKLSEIYCKTCADSCSQEQGVIVFI